MEKLYKILELAGKAGNRMLLAILVAAYAAANLVPANAWSDVPVQYGAVVVMVFALSMLLFNAVKAAWDKWRARCLAHDQRVEKLKDMTRSERAFMAALTNPEWGTGEIHWDSDPALDRLEQRGVIKTLKRVDGTDIHRFELVDWVAELMKRRKLRAKLLKGAEGGDIYLRSQDLNQLYHNIVEEPDREPGYL